MPPYEPMKSKAQSRALWAKASRGEISEDEVRGKSDATDYESLPDRVKRATSEARGKKPSRQPIGRAGSVRRQDLRRAQRTGR